MAFAILLRKVIVQLPVLFFDGCHKVKKLQNIDTKHWYRIWPNIYLKTA